MITPEQHRPRRRRRIQSSYRGTDMEEHVSPEERSGLIKRLYEAGFRGQGLRNAFALAVFVSILTTAYVSAH